MNIKLHDKFLPKAKNPRFRWNSFLVESQRMDKDTVHVVPVKFETNERNVRRLLSRKNIQAEVMPHVYEGEGCFKGQTLISIVYL